MKIRLVLFSLIVTLYGWLAWRFWFVCDDAFISFRYARNWATGAGLRYNIGDMGPVEGYSNLLWVMLCALVELVGADPVLIMPALSMMAGAGLLWLLFSALLRAVPLPLATLCTAGVAVFPPFFVWGTGGLETMLYALLLFALIDRLFLSARPAGVGVAAALGIGLTLCRGEGLVWGVGLPVLAAMVGRPEQRRRALAAAGVVLAAAALCRLICWGYYGDIVANTVRNKVTLSREGVAVGVRYVQHFLLTFLTPVLPALLIPVAIWRGRRAAAVVGLCFVGVYVYAVASGGDWMLMGRFLVPSLALGGLLLGWGLRPLWRGWGRPVVAAALVVVAVIGYLPATNRHLISGDLREAYSVRWPSKRGLSEVEVWYRWKESFPEKVSVALVLADALEPTDSMVSGVIGVVGYYGGMNVHDQFGLISRSGASVPPDWELPPGHQRHLSVRDFVDEEPTVLTVKVLDSDNPRYWARTHVRRWRAMGLADRYVPQLYTARDGQHVLLLQRIEGAPEVAWAEWKERMATL